MRDQFINGAIAARSLAKQCRDEAQTATLERSAYLMAEHDRHIERAEDYEKRASWCAQKIYQEIAA